MVVGIAGCSLPGARIPSTNGTLAAFEVASGRLLWRSGLPLVLPTVVAADGAVVVSPFRPGPAETVAAFDPATGHQKWNAPSEGMVALVPGEVVVAGSGGKLTAYDIKTGATRWGTDGVATAFAAAADVVIAVGRSRAFDGNAMLTALDLKTGKKLWEVAPDATHGPAEGIEPAIAGGTVYAAFNTRVPVAPSDAHRTLVAIALADGHKLWEIPLEPFSNSVAGPSVGGVAAAGVGSTAFGIDPRTGKQAWSWSHNDGGAGPFPGEVRADGSSVYVTDGKALTALSAAGGAVLWMVATEFTSLASAGGFLAVGGHRTVALYEAASGHELWLKPLSDFSGARVAMSAERVFAAEWGNPGGSMGE